MFENLKYVILWEAFNECRQLYEKYQGRDPALEEMVLTRIRGIIDVLNREMSVVSEDETVH